MSTKEEFIERIAPYAQKVQEKYGVPASIVIAQAAQETGWGEHVKGNNYFGIKSGSSKGESIAMRTHEVINGKSVSIIDNFRAYKGMADSVENYGKFLAKNSRYSGVVNADNAHEAANALQRAGYATDPQYAKKLKNIINSNKLTRFDNVKYKGYEQDDHMFEETNERLYEEREKNPEVWQDFIGKFLAGFVEMIAGLFKGITGGDDKTPTGEAPSVPRQKTGQAIS